MNQVAIPIEVRPEEVLRKKTLGASIEHCAELAGYALDKTLAMDCGFDKAQFSRWCSGTEGIIWPKLVKMMDQCGNDAPVLWMLGQRGYDLESVRKRQTATEQENERLRAQVRALRDVLLGGGLGGITSSRGGA